MNILSIVLAISTLTWFLTIFTQKKSSIFVFFLMLGISDPLIYASRFIWGVNSGVIYVITGILILIALRTDNFKSIKIQLLDYLILIAFIAFLMISINWFYFALGVHVFILINFIQRITVSLHFKGELNVFFLVLVFYEISLLLKGIVYASGTVSGLVLFSITLAFQILIAIFFIIFREDNPKLIIKMTRENL